MDMLSYLMGRSANGGTGSGLPSVSSSDVGAGLTVKGTPVAGTVIVPEQTASFDAENQIYPLSNGDASLFTVGAKVFITVDNTTYGPFTVDNDFYAGVYEEEYGVWTGYDNGRFFAAYELYNSSTGDYESPATITIKVTVADIQAEWGVGVPIVYDAIINIIPGDNTPAVLFGNYASVAAKLNDNKPVNILVYDQFLSSSVWWYRSQIVSCLPDGDNNRIRLYISAGNVWDWNSDGTLTYED